MPRTVEIRIIDEPDLYATYDAYVELLVDGKPIAQGTYGGEPEDNCRYRDYRWVEQALVALAEALGATASVTEIEVEADADA